MRIIKSAVISILGIALLVLAISLLLPSHTRVSRAATLPFSAESIAPLMNNLKQWGNWNLLVYGGGPVSYNSSSGTLIAGTLQVTVVNNTANEIVTKWQMKGGEPVMGHFVLLMAGKDTTIVQWYFDFDTGRAPWKKFGSIIYDRQLGPPMERSLEKLESSMQEGK